MLKHEDTTDSYAPQFRTQEEFMVAIPKTVAELWRVYTFVTIEPLLISFESFVDYSRDLAGIRLSPKNFLRVWLECEFVFVCVFVSVCVLV